MTKTPALSSIMPGIIKRTGAPLVQPVAADVAPVIRAIDASAVRAQFPGLRQHDGGRWHYLDSAATAQKPQAVIDAMANAMGRDYATVHRGVYARSADMTLAYEAARRRSADFIGGREDEIVFVRGATEAINLVAQSLPRSPSRPRVLLSALEHHSNIVPWQLAGYGIDVCPLTADGRIDLDAAARLVSSDHAVVAFAHVSNVLGGVLDVAKAAEIAHDAGARLLIDGCQAAARLPVDVASLGCDFYVFSGHKLYGPTGIGVLWGRKAQLDAMPPWQGGGSMIERVTFAQSSYLPAPARFEAGTPAIAEAIALHAAFDWVDALGRDAIHAHEFALVQLAREAMRRIPGVRLLGPDESAGIISFTMDGAHPHDIGTIFDESGVAIRAGHHCAQPLMDRLGVPATARASFAAYSDNADIDALVAGLERVARVFG